MRDYTSKFKILVFLFSIFYFIFYIFVNAQTSPQFFVSWQAQSYASSWYQGKILAINGTPVEISFELIDNGKIADLSKTKVRWYVNDDLVLNENNGLGIKNLKITVPDYTGQQTEIRIAVVDYLKTGLVDKLIKIPVVGPEAVINAPYPEHQILTGENSFQVFPFFFNVKNLDGLSVEWSTNEQKAEGMTVDPWRLSLKVDLATPLGFTFNLSATIRNFLNQLEFASKNIQLQVK